MQIRSSFVAHTQTTELVQPGKGAFHHPTQRTQPAIFIGATCLGGRRWG